MRNFLPPSEVNVVNVQRPESSFEVVNPNTCVGVEVLDEQSQIPVDVAAKSLSREPMEPAYGMIVNTGPSVPVTHS
jgi:hypothetical protein